MENKQKRLLVEIFCTKWGWLGISILGIIVFGLLTNIFEWAYIGAMISCVYPIILLIIGMVYAFIINPINERKNNKSE